MQTMIAKVDCVVTPSGARVELYTADEVRENSRGSDFGAMIRPLSETVDWCEHFLGRPHPHLGRSGNVCPFVPEAMLRGSLQFSLLRLKYRGRAAIDEIEGIVGAFREHFLREEKAQGKIDIFASMVMIFPDVTVAEAPFIIDPCQRKLKPSFVREGLMLGEFHPHSPAAGLRNPAFRPLRSPIPLLAIRHMVESDVDFLIAPSDSAETRTESLRAYLHCLGSSMSVATRTRAQEALRAAEELLFSRR